jgi:hypothetical protein
MQMNLKNARLLLDEINTQSNKLDNLLNKPTVEFSIYENIQWSETQVEQSLKEAHEVFVSALNDRCDLAKLKSQLRKLISETNHKEGIDNIMADIVYSKDVLNSYKNILATSTGKNKLSPIAIIRKLSSLKEKGAGSYGYNTESVVEYVVQDDFIHLLEGMIKRQNKFIKSLEDQLSALNINTAIEFEIPEKWVKVLL